MSEAKLPTEEKPKIGRRSKLTPDLSKELCGHLERGASLEIAAEAVGLNRSTVFAWRLRGEREHKRVINTKGAQVRKTEQPFIDFIDAIKKATARCELGLQNLVLRSAKGSEEIETQVTEKFEYDEEGKQRVKERKVVTSLLPPSWTAAAWMLERKFGYTRTDRLVLEKIIKEKIDLTLADLQGKISQDAINELTELFTRELAETVHPDGIN